MEEQEPVENDAQEEATVEDGKADDDCPEEGDIPRKKRCGRGG